MDYKDIAYAAFVLLSMGIIWFFAELWRRATEKVLLLKLDNQILQRKIKRLQDEQNRHHSHGQPRQANGKFVRKS